LWRQVVERGGFPPHGGWKWERRRVPGFFGRYEHSLDAKGRIILPAKLRSHFDLEAFVTEYHDGCLAIWTPDAFQQQLDAMSRIQVRGEKERRLARFWSSGAYQAELDRQGRISIPPALRKFAGLESAVLVVGAIDRVELWDPAAWEARMAEARESLAAGTAPSFGPGGQD
jgi:MraZ protein